jgi:hypothetical protein
MRIKFLQRTQYESEGRGKGPVYDKDSIHDFPDAFAQKWLRRGKAVGVIEPAVAAKAAPAPAEEPAAEADRKYGFRGERGAKRGE